MNRRNPLTKPLSAFDGGFEWTGLDVDTLDDEFMAAEPSMADLEPFERMRQMEVEHG